MRCGSCRELPEDAGLCVRRRDRRVKNCRVIGDTYCPSRAARIASPECLRHVTPRYASFGRFALSSTRLDFEQAGEIGFTVGERVQTAGRAWYRGEHCNFNPALANMRAHDAI